MIKNSIYLYNQPINTDTLNKVCDLVNYAISEGDNLYGTNDGAKTYYTPDFLNRLRKVHNMNIQCAQDTFGDLLGCCYHYLDPKRSYKNPEWMEDEDNPTPILLNSFVVDPEYRGTGIGTKMIRRMQDYYSPMNEYSSIILKVIDENNNARNVYNNCGFTEYRNVIDDNIPHTVMIYRFIR